MSVFSSGAETPDTFKVKFPFQKKKEGAPGDAPDKAHPSQTGLPTGEDDEKFSTISLSDGDESDKGDAGVSPDVGVPPSSQKRHLWDQGMGVSTPKKPATEEGPALTQELMLPAGVHEDHLLPHRYNVYLSDYNVIQRVRASLLELAPGTIPDVAHLNSSPRFTLCLATSEKEPPEIMMSHWLPIL